MSKAKAKDVGLKAPFAPLGTKCVITSNSETFGGDFGRLYGTKLASAGFDIYYSRLRESYLIWVRDMDDIARMRTITGHQLRLDYWTMKDFTGLAIIVDDDYKYR